MTKVKRILGVLTIALSMLSMSPLLTSSKATELEPVAGADQCFFCRCSNGKCVCVQIVCPT
jgi:hypothetical protein